MLLSFLDSIDLFLHHPQRPRGSYRDDRMFVVKVNYKNRQRPWALTLIEPVPEAFEFPASDWPQIFLWPIGEEKQPGDSDLFFPHRSP